jgi:hypothetical protein
MEELTLGAGINIAGTTLSVRTTFRTSYTWSLMGDLGVLNGLFAPGPYISLTGTQTARIIGVRGRIHSGTSVGIEIYRTDVSVGTFTITPTRTTTAANIPLSNDDEMLLRISGVSGTCTNMNVSLLVEIIP